MKKIFNDFWRVVTRYFLAGVFAILPLVVTVAIVSWVSTYLVTYLGPKTTIGHFLDSIGLSILPNSTFSYVVGWTLVLVVILTLGMVVELGAKSLFNHTMESLFGRVPIIGNIYRTSRQVVEMLDTNSEEAVKGMTAVYCYFGSKQGPAILAFLVSPKKFLIEGGEYQIVMIPTAPIPFGGAMLLVPSDLVVNAGLSVDAMMSVYLSMGVAAPDYIATTEGPPKVVREIKSKENKGNIENTGRQRKGRKRK
jgi:uncharacterized membrane protein